MLEPTQLMGVAPGGGSFEEEAAGDRIEGSAGPAGLNTPHCQPAKYDARGSASCIHTD